MRRSRTTPGSWAHALETSALWVALLFFVAFIDWFFPFPLNVFGILPRTAWGLIGIICSPFLHINAAHLLANALPLFILLVLLFWDRRYRPEETLIGIWLLSGIGTWLIGRGDAIHIGASSIVYGLVIYLIVAGWALRSWRCAFVALIVLISYGGILHGALPQDGPMSWEGHLSGVIAGFWMGARRSRRR